MPIGRLAFPGRSKQRPTRVLSKPEADGLKPPESQQREILRASATDALRMTSRHRFAPCVRVNGAPQMRSRSLTVIPDENVRAGFPSTALRAGGMTAGCIRRLNGLQMPARRRRYKPENPCPSYLRVNRTWKGNCTTSHQARALAMAASRRARPAATLEPRWTRRARRLRSART
jgi:hypothetical protein